MSIRTIPLADLTVMLRRPFEPYTNGEGVPLADSKTGEPVFVGEATAPGFIASAYAVGQDRPETVRVKIVGTQPALAEGSFVRLVGCQATAWFLGRSRGVDAKSALTITASRVEPGKPSDFRARGGLPAHSGGVGVVFLGQTADGVADVVFDANGPFVVEGVAAVKVDHQLPVSLVGARVEIEGLVAYYTSPDQVSDRNRSEILLTATNIREAVSAPAFTAPKPVQPVQPVEPKPAAEVKS